MSISKARQQHLKKILVDEYSSNRNELAQKLNIALSTLNKYLSVGKYRAISDKTARQFEKRLGHKAKYLDNTQHNESNNIYYVRVTFSGGHPHEFLRKLRHHDIVKEASAQYGEADIFIKIEAPEEEYQSLIFNTIRLFPNVTKTTTSQALNTSRWQRDQAEFYQLPKEAGSPHYILQDYIETKRQELYDELNDLDAGRKIVVNKNDIHSIDYYELLENSKHKIMMTLFYNLQTQVQLEKEFFESREKTHRDVQFKILLLTNNTRSGDLDQRLNEFTHTLRSYHNTEVHIMNAKSWIGDRREPNGMTLTIIDDLIVSILKGNSFTLGYKAEVVEHYSKIFERNWVKTKNQGRFY